MKLESWDPRLRLQEFRQQTNVMLDELLQAVSSEFGHAQPIAFEPEVDLVETPADFRFYLSIPGLVEDDLVIDVDGDLLTIQGERHPPYDAGQRAVGICEWRYGFFERRFELPVHVEVTTIRAAYDAGVLTIVAQKLEKPKSPTGDIGHSGDKQ